MCLPPPLLNFFLLEKNEKCIDLTDLERKLIRKVSKKSPLSGGSSMRRNESEDPHRHEQNFLLSFFLSEALFFYQKECR